MFAQAIHVFQDGCITVTAGFPGSCRSALNALCGGRVRASFGGDKGQAADTDYQQNLLGRIGSDGSVFRTFGLLLQAGRYTQPERANLF